MQDIEEIVTKYVKHLEGMDINNTLISMMADDLTKDLHQIKQQAVKEVVEKAKRMKYDQHKDSDGTEKAYYAGFHHALAELINSLNQKQ